MSRKGQPGTESDRKSDSVSVTGPCEDLCCSVWCGKKAGHDGECDEAILDYYADRHEHVATMTALRERAEAAERERDQAREALGRLADAVEAVLHHLPPMTLPRMRARLAGARNALGEIP